MIDFIHRLELGIILILTLYLLIDFIVYHWSILFTALAQ